MIYLAVFVFALVMTMALIPPLIQVSGKLGLVDRPGDRKVHVKAVPRIGGVSMVLGVLLPVILWIDFDNDIGALLIGAGILFVFGVWDDRGDLDYRLKFFGQILAAITFVVYGDVVIGFMPFFGMDPVSKWLSMPLTVIAIVVVTNSVNLADGLDGLAAGLMLLTLLGIALLAYLADGADVLLVALALMGVIVGFLRFNTYPAQIFMGDTGSQFLGFCVVTLLIILTQKTSPVLNPALPLLLLGVPLFDTSFVIIKRLYTGKSPFVADKNHIHHQLLALKFNHIEAVILIYFIQSLFVGGAVLLRYHSDLTIVAVWLLANITLACVLVAAGHRRWISRSAASESLTASVLTLSRSRYLYLTSVAVITICMILLLVAGPFLVSEIGLDFGIAAAVLFLLLLLRLLFGFRLWYLSLRLITYVTVAFILFLISEYPSALIEINIVVEYLYFGFVCAALLVGSRFTIVESFRATPMDFLLIIVMAGLVFIPQAHIVDDAVIHLLIKIFIMFYAAEFVLRNMKTLWSGFTVSMLCALGIIAARGLVIT